MSLRPPSAHPLVIACCDFFHVEQLLEGLLPQPDDALHVRTPANIVPRDLASSPQVALRYGVEIKGARDVIVLGHTRCLVLRSLIRPGATSPMLEAWRADGARTRYLLSEHHVGLSPMDRLRAAACENAVEQLERLQGLPTVQQREVRLHAWVYDEGEEQTYALDPRRHVFELLEV